jgi:hypothetical protein
MPVRDDEMIIKTVDYFVTESTFNPKATSSEIQEFMEKCATTGTTVFSTNNGGFRGAILTEKLRLNDKQAREVRRTIGMRCEAEVA